MKTNLQKLDVLTAQYRDRYPDLCACVTMSTRQKYTYLLGTAFLIFLLFLRWDYFVFLICFTLMMCYGFAVLLRLGAAMLSICGHGQVSTCGHLLNRLEESDLPLYTLLLPLYRESAVAEKILKRIDRLDYPKDKLDVKLLLEADDRETRAALQKIVLPPYCHVIDIPDGLLRTKPRACNYGLAAAKGKYSVIYDAEDAPEPDQLKKAVIAFRDHDSDGKLLCVQARLNYYNRNQNWLTRFFTVEYSTYFDLTLGGLQAFRLPLPLGGTSNHFKTAELQSLGGWDPFNVTEDCDLGIRIYEDGCRTILLDSTTWEEANSRPWNWLRQRSRWVKGFIQTHFVHYRHPMDTIRRLTLWGAGGCYVLVGGSVVMMLANLIFWPLILLYLFLLVHGECHGETLLEMMIGPRSGQEIYRGISVGAWHIKAWPLMYVGADENVFFSRMSQVFFLGSIVLLFSNFLLILVHVAACIKRRFFSLIPWALLMPLYWVMISMGAWKGAIQFFTNPFYWEKTIHGLDDEVNIHSTEVSHAKSNVLYTD